MADSPQQSNSTLGQGATAELYAPADARRRFFGSIMTALVVGCTLIALIPLVAILLNVFIKGGGRLDVDIFTELPPPPLVKGGGMRNAFFGTLITLLIGSLLSVPIGILTAIYTVEFGRGTKAAGIVRFCTNVLSGVPSIIAGLFAYGIVVLTTGNFSAVAGGVALSVLMVPIVIRTVEEGLKSIPREIRLASIGVGANDFQTISRVVIPAVMPFIATGITLSLARAAGETAPLLFTALFSQFGFNGPWEPVATLSVLIYNFAISPYQNQQELAWVASLVIILLILFISIMSRYLTRRKVF
ncbi:phosphate ABC transporter permease PstA [Acaryochloris thomasi]|nr:phosphate ABC transporter permease PstA [Acaryochloris thomasi]